MNTEQWGVTERGFHCPTYTEVLDTLEYKARELFGAKANLTVRSPLGLFLRIFAWAIHLLFQLAEDVYNSRFIDTAAGTSLYNLGKAIGLRLLPAQKAAGYLKVTGRPGTTINKGFLVSTISGLQYVCLIETQIGDTGTAIVPVQAFNAGEEYNTGPGTITVVVNPTDGITAVTNTKSVDGGRARETDEQFRDRYAVSVDFAGGVNIEAIIAEILQTVEGVSAALGFENDTDEKNELGLPPHSIEAIVYGGLDTDIAEAIFRRKAGGIQTYGNTSVPVISASEQSIDIYFSRPSPVPIWVRITNLVTTTAFPLDGQQRIKQALINYIGGDVTGGLGIGASVIYMTLPTVIFSVEGVKDFDLEISKDGSRFGDENIDVNTREKAVTDEGKVSVT